MTDVFCPFQRQFHPDEDGGVTRVNRRMLKRSHATGNTGGELESWCGDTLVIDLYDCDECRHQGWPEDVRSFGYSKKYDAYICLFEDGSWKHLSSLVVDYQSQQH